MWIFRNRSIKSPGQRHFPHESVHTESQKYLSASPASSWTAFGADPVTEEEETSAWETIQKAMEPNVSLNMPEHCSQGPEGMLSSSSTYESERRPTSSPRHYTPEPISGAQFSPLAIKCGPNTTESHTMASWEESSVALKTYQGPQDIPILSREDTHQFYLSSLLQSGHSCTQSEFSGINIDQQEVHDFNVPLLNYNENASPNTPPAVHSNQPRGPTTRFSRPTTRKFKHKTNEKRPFYRYYEPDSSIPLQDRETEEENGGPGNVTYLSIGAKPPDPKACELLYGDDTTLVVAVNGIFKGSSKRRGAGARNLRTSCHAAVGIYFGKNSPWNLGVLLDQSQLSLGLFEDETPNADIIDLLAGLWGLQCAVDMMSYQSQAGTTHRQRKSPWTETIIIKTTSHMLTNSMSDFVMKWRLSWLDNSKKPIVGQAIVMALDKLASDLECKGYDIRFWHVSKDQNKQANRSAEKVISSLSGIQNRTSTRVMKQVFDSIRVQRTWVTDNTSVYGKERKCQVNRRNNHEDPDVGTSDSPIVISDSEDEVSAPRKLPRYNCAGLGDPIPFRTGRR